MIVLLAASSVLGLYAELVMQLCALLSYRDNLGHPLSILLLSLLLLSLLLANLSSLLLVLKHEAAEVRGRARGVCVLLHVVQLGMVWRVYQVCVRYTKTAWLTLASLRLIHVSLTSFLFLIVQSRVVLLPEPVIKSLPVYVLSLVVSLCSCTVALCSYSLRHRLHEMAVMVDMREGSSPAPSPPGCAGVALLMLGTLLCVASRLAAFALLSAQHAFWTLLPFSLHFSLQAFLRFRRSPCTRGPTSLPTTSQNLARSPHTDPTRPITTLTAASALPPSSTPTPKSPPSPAHPTTTTTVKRLLSGLVKAYLNTFDLVEEEGEGRRGRGRVRCGYVLFYAVMLVENLAMTAAWMLSSSLGYRDKLVLLVVLLVAFLMAMVLKAASCRCVVRAMPSPAASLGSPDSPRVFTALQAPTAADGDSGQWIEGREDYRRTSRHRANQDFRLFPPRERASTGISLAAVSSLAGSEGRQRGLERGDQHKYPPRPDLSLTAGLPESVLKKAVRDQLSATQSRGNAMVIKTKIRRLDKDRLCGHFVGSSDGKALVTEDHQHHLHELIKDHYNSPEIAWMASLGTVAEHPDGCSFDDPILASRIVLRSLAHRPPESLHSSSSKSRQRPSHQGSEDGHFRRHDKGTPNRQVVLTSRTGTSDSFPDSRTGRGGAGQERDDVGGDVGQYRYMTRCSCRGSPSSTPRRRPGHQHHARKTHSYGSAHHSHHHHHHHHRHHRHRTVPRTGSLLRSDSNSLPRSGSKEVHRFRVPRSLSLTSREGSTWADYCTLSRNPPRPPPPSSHTRVDSDSSISSSSSSYLGSRRHRSQCRRRGRHRGGKDSSERAATWPRRQRRHRQAKGRQPRAGGMTLPKDAVCTHRVVQSWLQGLEPADPRPQPHLHSDGDSSGPLSGTHRAQRQHSSSDDSFSDDDDDEDEQEGNEDSVCATKGKRLRGFRGAMNQSKLNVKRRQQNRSPLSNLGSSDKYSLYSGNVTKQNRRNFWSSENKMASSTSAVPFTFTDRATFPTGLKSNKHFVADLSYATPHQDHLHPHDRKVTWMNSLDMDGSRLRLKGQCQQTISRLKRSSYASPAVVPDSGVSLSTVQDSDGSRSNTQGHSIVNAEDYFSAYKLSAPYFRTLQQSELLKATEHNEAIPAAKVHTKMERKPRIEPSLSNSQLQEPITLTLDVDESLV
ncbi:hypothetical protein ACOMHN_051179 [Nucella lapillus]